MSVFKKTYFVGDWQEEFGQDQSAAEILATPRNQENILSARTKKVSNDDDETTEDEGGNKFLRFKKFYTFWLSNL